jgi:hypothetical protein
MTLGKLTLGTETERPENRLNVVDQITQEEEEPVIGRKLFGVFAVLVLAGVMGAATVDAKSCKALCHTQIQSCYSAQCTGLKGHDKRDCKKTCKSHFLVPCKDSAPKAKDRTCPSSPSAAFLD